MKTKALLLLSTMALVRTAYAQEPESSPLQFSGSVDTYYKYDFQKQPNISTSFANDHNSLSLGMIDIALKKTTGKASFWVRCLSVLVANLRVLVNGDGTDSEWITTLLTCKTWLSLTLLQINLRMTAGFMATFVGYEVISPVGNFNYSTSYLFSAGPFQNAGIKGTYTFSPKVSVMLGMFDDWNVYKDLNGISHFGAQLGLFPVEGWSAYLNVLTGKNQGAVSDGSLFDLTTAYQVRRK